MAVNPPPPTTARLHYVQKSSIMEACVQVYLCLVKPLHTNNPLKYCLSVDILVVWGGVLFIYKPSKSCNDTKRVVGS